MALADWLEDHPPHPAVGGFPSALTTAGPRPPVEVMPGPGRLTAPETEAVAVAVGGVSAEPPRSTHGRAAELAARVRGLRDRLDTNRESVRHSSPDGDSCADALTPELIGPPAPDVPPEPPPDPVPEPPHTPEPDRVPAPLVPASFFGATLTDRGVRFAQPAGLGQSIHVAGDFNHWSQTATPLTYDEITGAHQALVEIPPGRYQYRLVIDGRWRADSYNEHRHLNDYNEQSNVLIVPVAGEQP